jgi:predicted nucleotidyltransferase
MTPILKVIVGSKLHRLDNEHSDTDTKGIYATNLRELVSPFHGKDKAKQETADDTFYELRHFCNLATKGNPTVLEVLWSDMPLFQTPMGKELVMNRQKFLDSKNIRAAHMGYAKSQRKKVIRHGLSDERTRKHLVAHLRVLIQGATLLILKDMFPDFSRDFPYEYKEMLDVKNGRGNFDYIHESIRYWEEKLENLTNNIVPDYEWISDFCYRIYTENHSNWPTDFWSKNE